MKKCMSVWVIGAFALLGLTGCFEHGTLKVERHPPHREAYVRQPGVVLEQPPVMVREPEVVVVRSAPPPPRVEVIPVRPSPRHVWIGGHWGRHRDNWGWISGRYEAKPHERAVWVQDRWERRGDEWRYAPGHWKR